MFNYININNVNNNNINLLYKIIILNNINFNNDNENILKLILKNILSNNKYNKYLYIKNNDYDDNNYKNLKTKYEKYENSIILTNKFIIKLFKMYENIFDEEEKIFITKINNFEMKEFKMRCIRQHINKLINKIKLNIIDN